MFFLGNRASVLTQELIYKMLNQSLQEIQKRSVQENVYIITGGVTTITNGIITAFISLVSDLVLLFVMLSGLFYVDPKTATLSILLFGFISFSKDSYKILASSLFNRLFFISLLIISDLKFK